MLVTFFWHMREYWFNNEVRKGLMRRAALLCIEEGNEQTFADLALVAKQLLPRAWKLEFIRATAVYFCAVNSALTIKLLNEKVQNLLDGDEDMERVLTEWEYVETESEAMKSRLDKVNGTFSLSEVAIELAKRLESVDVKIAYGDVVYYANLVITQWNRVEDRTTA